MSAYHFLVHRRHPDYRPVLATGIWKTDSVAAVERGFGRRVAVPRTLVMEVKMGRGILLWLLGVPIPVIILLWFFFGR